MRSVSLALLLPLAALADTSSPDSGPSLISTHGKAAKGDPKVQLQKDASAGDGKAAYELASDYENGKGGFPKDLIQAFTWYMKSGADGDGDGYFRLGMIYDDGIGVTQDSPRALGYFKAAAGMGVAEAQYNVGTLLVSAHGGVKRDWTEGLAWLIVAGRNGAAGDGEQAVRKHLARRPEIIAAAEKRANDLLASRPHFDPPSPDTPPSSDTVPDVPPPPLEVPPTHIGPPGT